MAEDEMDGITNSMDMSLSKLPFHEEGQGCLACCSLFKESDMTEKLDNNNIADE